MKARFIAVGLNFSMLMERVSEHILNNPKGPNLLKHVVPVRNSCGVFKN